MRRRGKRLLLTEGLWPALRYLTTFRTRHEAMAAQGLLYAFVPGVASLVWPAVWWQAAATLAMCVVGALLVVRATGWPLAEGWGWAALAWASSFVLCAYAVHGFFWGGVFLPYALVLAGVWGAQRAWVSVVLVLLGLELAWHTYELAKLVGVLAVLAALTTTERPQSLRLVWAVAGLLELYGAFVLWPTGNFGTFVRIGTAAMQGASEAESRQLGTLAQAGWDLVRAFGTWTPGTRPQGIDFPTLPALGLVGALLAGRRRNLALAFWLFTVLLLVVLTVSHQLLPRRAPLFLWASLTCLLAGLRVQPRLRPIAGVLLALTVVAQLAGMARHAASARFDTSPMYPIPGWSAAKVPASSILPGCVGRTKSCGASGRGKRSSSSTIRPATRRIRRIRPPCPSGSTCSSRRPSGGIGCTRSPRRPSGVATTACRPIRRASFPPCCQSSRRGRPGVTFDPACTLMGQGAPMAALRARFPPPTVVLEDRFEFIPAQ